MDFVDKLIADRAIKSLVRQRQFAKRYHAEHQHAIIAIAQPDQDAIAFMCGECGYRVVVSGMQLIEIFP